MISARVCATILALALATEVTSSRAQATLRQSVGRPLSVKVDSVALRHDITRVYGKLIGTPQTSDRVDSAVIESSKKRYKATDIDGIDFKRHFQWGDEGVILIEIDFPPMKKADGWLVLKTIRGDVSTQL